MSAGGTGTALRFILDVDTAAATQKSGVAYDDVMRTSGSSDTLGPAAPTLC